MNQKRIRIAPLIPRQKEGLHFAPKGSRINPGRVWRKPPKGKMEGSLRGHFILASPSS
jgi:hypothetical protein